MWGRWGLLALVAALAMGCEQEPTEEGGGDTGSAADGGERRLDAGDSDDAQATEADAEPPRPDAATADAAPDATPPVPEDCNTPGDEDGDGDADCADSDCAGTPACPSACRRPADCPPNYDCVDGTCVEFVPECARSPDCDEGHRCDAGRCVPHDGRCAVADDCPAGQECANGTCAVPPECRRDEDCEAGERCRRNECLAPGECRQDFDCGGGLRCHQQQCVDQIPCANVADCPERNACIRGQCIPGNPCGDFGDCPRGEQCLEGICIPFGGCFVDEDCGDPLFVRCQNFQCVERLDFCAADAECPAGTICHQLDGVCRPQNPWCNVDEHCGQGFACVFGFCQERPLECLNHVECPRGFCSEDYQCRPLPAACAGNAECPAGFDCVDGACAARPPECAGDADCREGRVCGAGRCVVGVALGDNVAFGHHGSCETWNDCGVGRTCAQAACDRAQAGEAIAWAEGRCDGRRDLDCNLFHGLPDLGLDEDWFGGEFCPIPVVYDVVCGVPEGGARIVGDAPGHGRVEIFIGEVWGSVCPEGFDLSAGDVVCRQAGFPGAAEVLGPVGGEVAPLLDGVACGGGEASLLACGHAPPGEVSCDAADAVGVRCLDAGACRDDGHCRAGSRCFEGRCLAPGQCPNDAACPDGAICVEGRCTGAERLGAARGFGHVGACDSWNECRDPATCANAACRAAGFGAAHRYAEGRCEDVPGLDCDVFTALPDQLDTDWASMGCNLPVVYDVVCRPNFVFVGPYRLGQGPEWFGPGVVSYTCLEACALVFGGDQSDYACSSNERELDHRAHVDGWGDDRFCHFETVDEDFKEPREGPYDCGREGCSYSAYVSDHCPEVVNYCWRR